jgi:hypothetical protein
MQTEAENPSPASDSPAGESAPSADHIQEREGEETRPSGETASLRPDFGNSPILIDAIKRIGRKRLAHGVGTEEIREYFGFGAIESRQTVPTRRVYHRGNDLSPSTSPIQGTCL